jgi:hypothetical protein
MVRTCCNLERRHVLPCLCLHNLNRCCSVGDSPHGACVGYIKWRPWAVYVLRLPPTIGMYVSYEAQIKRLKAPSFSLAAWVVGVSFARFKPGFYIALFYQVRSDACLSRFVAKKIHVF